MERLKERNITRKQVAQAIMSGEIIEQNPDSQPLPGVLILGYIADSIPLHIAVRIEDYRIVLVTAYVPALDKWESGYKTRKVIV
jgi:hypothetical protein